MGNQISIGFFLRTLQQKSSFARVFGVFFQKSQDQEKLQ